MENDKITEQSHIADVLFGEDLCCQEEPKNKTEISRKREKKKAKKIKGMSLIASGKTLNAAGKALKAAAKTMQIAARVLRKAAEYTAKMAIKLVQAAASTGPAAVVLVPVAVAGASVMMAGAAAMAASSMALYITSKVTDKAATGLQKADNKLQEKGYKILEKANTNTAEFSQQHTRETVNEISGNSLEKQDNKEKAHIKDVLTIMALSGRIQPDKEKSLSQPLEKNNAAEYNDTNTELQSSSVQENSQEQKSDKKINKKLYELSGRGQPVSHAPVRKTMLKQNLIIPKRSRA